MVIELSVNNNRIFINGVMLWNAWDVGLQMEWNLI